MKCPHCSQGFHDAPDRLGTRETAKHPQTRFVPIWQLCPECGGAVIELEILKERLTAREPGLSGQAYVYAPAERLVVWPRTPIRGRFRAEKLGEYGDDYHEACSVFDLSPKASAALSRRCLQRILRENAKVKPGNLADEIQEVLDGGALPSYIRTSVDAVRHFGNFAAHPNKSTTSGEIIDVEPGEAEWTLEVLENLLDFYVIQPAEAAERKAKLNLKLADAGKPPMKA